MAASPKVKLVDVKGQLCIPRQKIEIPHNSAQRPQIFFAGFASLREKLLTFPLCRKVETLHNPAQWLRLFFLSQPFETHLLIGRNHLIVAVK
jgi:hypothetical protein